LKKIFFLMLLMFISVSVYSIPKSPKVLILNSYHEGYHWTDLTMKGIKSVLYERADLDIIIEYMDTKRFSDERYFRMYRDILVYKYKNKGIDIVISTDDHAFNFLKKYGETIFSDIPVIFSGINNFKESMIKNKKNFSGIYESSDPAGTIKIMKALHPETEIINVILDNSVSANALYERISDVEKKFTGILKFRYLKNLSFREMKRRLSSLNDKDLVLWGIYMRTPDGKYLSSKKSIQMMTSYTDRPFYCIWDVVGQGVVGGVVSSPVSQGKTVAGIALNVLDGQDVSTLPVEGGSLQYIFDYNVLKKYNIPKSKLPGESIIRNTPFSVYREYRGYILLTVLFVVFLMISNIVLILNVWKRKIAEKKFSETYEQLLHSNRMEAVGKLSGGLAHDFNNMLTVITSSISIMKLNSEHDNTEMNECIDLIEKTTHKASDIISQLMVFSRKEDVDFTELSLHSIIDNSLLLLKSSLNKNIKLHFMKNAESDYIMCNSVQIQSSIMNILINADHAMADGGDIFITTRNVNIENGNKHKYDLNIRCGEYIEIEIRDNGTGIAKENLQKIFDPFFTTKQIGEGTGLGLSMVYGIVKNHGGSIMVESSPGEGTSFYLLFPLSMKMQLSPNCS